MPELKYDDVEHQTEGAVLFIFDDEAKWVPRKLIRSIDYKNHIVEIADWFVEKEGLNCYTI